MDTYNQLASKSETTNRPKLLARQWLASRLPGKDETFSVFSLIVFIVFTWAIYQMVWKLPSWLFLMGLLQISVVAAYVLAFALIESLVMLASMLLLALIIPRRLFRDKFVPQASLLVTILSLLAIYLQGHLNLLTGMALAQLVILPFIFLIGIFVYVLLFSILIERTSVVPRLIQAAANRLTVFAYVYVPISLLCLLVVIARNIL